MRTSPPPYIANFDSTAAMLRATARYLRGKDFPALGLPFMQPAISLANRLPQRSREKLFAVGAASESIPGRFTGMVRGERLSKWAAGLYPERQYPAVAIGSAGGALVHLCAALHMPWLPQTFFVPVYQTDTHPDEIKKGMGKGLRPGRRLVEANPDLQLHHMHDPSQDRLNLHLMTYFRVKRLRMGLAYERFVEQRLEPGGTIFLVECQKTWPTTRVGKRHIFQAGAVGGTEAEEFFEGSEEVAQFLRQRGSPLRKWDPPAPDGQRPEAEWGFAPELRESVMQFARQNEYRVVRVVFQNPQELSPLVADLYRWWYRQRRLKANRLVAESFILLEPYWTLRTGSVPFWMLFNMERSAQELERYLDGAEPFDDIRMMLFSNGVESIRQVPIHRWRQVLGRARQRSSFVGVDEEEYPRDFASFARYHTGMKELAPRYPLPGPLALSQLETFLKEHGDRYEVEWILEEDGK